MAQIRSFLFARHLRAESTAHILAHRHGKLVRSERGLSMWFLPLSTSIAEVPTDDREVAISAFVRSKDFLDVSVQGSLAVRVVDPTRLAARIDFAIDTVTGLHLRQPLDRLALQLSQLAQAALASWAGPLYLREMLLGGPATAREQVLDALEVSPLFESLGLALASVHIASVLPSNEIERALEAPMRERIQQEADEAAFSRRAAAVDKERAIAENELANRVELAKREEQLIAQEGANQRQRAKELAESQRIAVESEAAKRTISSTSEMEALRRLEGARVELEAARLKLAQDTSPTVLAALAARELASKLTRIDHLHVGGDVITSVLSDLASASARVLEGQPKALTGTTR
jgi:regulator of protease activity HflC (stomatin/prohibitin superfamily)